MQIVSGIVVFIIIWWVVIFCVLPIGVSTTQETPEEEGGYIAPGAPKNINMKQKLILTTGISIVLWIIVYFIITSGVVDFRAMVDLQE